MDTEADILSGAEPIAYPVDSTEPMSLEDAVHDLGAAREKLLNPPAESAQEATAETESSAEGDAAADEDQPTGEDTEADPPEKASLELPRSWTKDRAEVWNRLDPAAQEILLDQDRKASAEVRRVQNEAAEERKAAKAEREAAEQVRKQYEAKLPALEKKIQTIGPFADIQSMDDVKNLQRNDPFRFQEYQVYQWELAAEQTDLKAAQDRQAQEHQTSWAKHVQSENELAAELIPELADEKKGPALMKRAAERLADLGFKPDELNSFASGKEKLSIYDHRFQQLVADSLKLADIRNAPKAVTSKPVPQVQRPGTAKPANAGVTASIQTLEKQLANATGDRAVEISTQIYQLEQKAAARQKG